MKILKIDVYDVITSVFYNDVISIFGQQKHLTLEIEPCDFSYDFLTNFLRVSYDFLTRFLRFSYEVLTSFLRFSYEFLTSFLRFSYEFLTIFLRVSYDFLKASAIEPLFPINFFVFKKGKIRL